MGLFQGIHHSDDKTPDEEKADAVEHLLDDDFREEMRDRARLYFDRVINENAALFKQDLDATVAHINTELKQHVARQLDEQFVEIARVNNELKEHISTQLDERLSEFDKTMKEAQDMALQSLHHSAEALQGQHQQLSQALQKDVTEQEAMLHSVFEENKAHMISMKDAQASALQWLNESAQAMQEQNKQVAQTLQKNVAAQEEMLVSGFEQNMAQIVEHYLLGALGDQYDLKSQLPSIIKQMETNKQAIVDDMKL